MSDKTKMHTYIVHCVSHKTKAHILYFVHHLRCYKQNCSVKHFKFCFLSGQLPQEPQDENQDENQDETESSFSSIDLELSGDEAIEMEDMSQHIYEEPRSLTFSKHF